jgi:hypothetical protein
MEIEIKCLEQVSLKKFGLSYIIAGLHINTNIIVVLQIDNKIDSLDLLNYDDTKEEYEKLNKKEKEDMFKELLEMKYDLFDKLKNQ